jgi:hypothetical protein
VYKTPKPKGETVVQTFYHLQRAVERGENHAVDDFIVAARRLLKMG